jgi:hypothetical protein
MRYVTLTVLAYLCAFQISGASAAPQCRREQSLVNKSAAKVIRTQRRAERLQITFARKQESGRIRLARLQDAIARASVLAGAGTVREGIGVVGCFLQRRNCVGRTVNGIRRSSGAATRIRVTQANYDRYANLLSAQLSRLSTQIASAQLEIAAAQKQNADATAALNACLTPPATPTPAAPAPTTPAS